MPSAGAAQVGRWAAFFGAQPTVRRYNIGAGRRSSGVERLFCKQRVAGSNPAAGSNRDRERSDNRERSALAGSPIR